MFKNYFITTLRNLKKTKLFSFINISGLSIGMAACLLILHYVNFENSYDKFHEDSELIYRLRYERTSEDGSAVRFASCCPPAGKLIRERYPEAGKLARVFQYKGVVSFEDIRFTENRMFFMDPEFFEIFNFTFIEGEAVTSLKEPNRAFISESTAKKYFGSENPMGKRIDVNKNANYEITGVFKDIPGNSHLKFDVVLSFENLHDLYGPDYFEAWGHTGMYTYLKMKSGSDLSGFQNKLDDLVESEFGEALKEYNMRLDLVMQPLEDIHLNSHYMQEYEINGNLNAVNFLFMIAVLIIIIAWVNYINLSTARSLIRAREVGLRKVVGASRTQIIIQFFLETVILNLISIVLALLIITIVLPYFNNLTSVPPEINIWNQNWFWTILAGLFFFGIFISGIYPILALSSFRPALVLKGKLGTSGKGANLRRILVATQFILAIALIAATFAVFKQINFMRHQDLGFNVNQILVVKAPRVRGDNFGEKVVTLKDKLIPNSNIEKMCVVTEVPGRQILWDAGGIMKAGEDISKSKNYQIVGIDYDFFDVFDIELVAGRSFSKEYVSDNEALLLNETALTWMGFDDPQSSVGQKVDYWGNIYTIIGIVKDYHQQSLKESFEPHIFRLMPQGRGRLTLFALEINAGKMKQTLEIIETAYTDFFPGNPFDYFFLDEYFDQQYKSDELLGNVFGIFSSLAIFVTSLGILGLAAFMTTQRTKEIGIRKVLGAGIKNVLVLMISDFMKLIAISFILVSPFLYWGINLWLESFATQMEITTDLFIGPLLLVAGITIFTVGTHVIRAAIADPIKALRYE